MESNNKSEVNFLTICPLCNSKVIKSLIGYEKSYLANCVSCGFVFSFKIPSSLDLKNHYSRYTRGNNISSITIKRYDNLLNQFEKFRKNNTLIDIGCGDGYFLDRAKKRGWKVFGTEFTEGAIEFCRRKGLDVISSEGYLKKFEYGYFDIITSFEVLEHLNKPQEEVENYYSLIREGGMCYVTTPNFNSLSRRILKGKWNVIEYPEHLSYYTSATLKKLFETQTLDAIKIKSTGFSFARWKSSGNLNDERNSSDENIRANLESNFFLRGIKNLANLILGAFRMGDTLKGYFIKKHRI